LGDRLLSPDRYAGVMIELDSLKATGVKAVNVQLYFPILYAGYYSSAAEHQKYVDFYKRLAVDVRARGMKFIARCSLLMSQQGFSTVNTGPYYQSLTLEQYKAGRISTILTVLDHIRPDYMIVLNEPDVEALQVGKPEIGSVSGSTDFLRAILAAVQATGIQGTSIGAGMGTWSSHYDEFIQSFLSTGINFLDLHVYPANRDFLPRLIQAADLAQAAGKGMAISEAWLQKVADNEMGTLPVQTVFSRDGFSFWAPLDEKFLRALVKFSHYKKLLFFSPFWSQYFHAYIDYDTVASLTPAEITSRAASASTSNLWEGKFTSTAVAYAQAIAVTPDVTSPGAPAGLTAYTISNNSIQLTWTASTDNTGVAGYKVYRDGTLVGTTAYLFWQDIGLAANTTYTYTVAAYDIIGNTSAAAPVTARTNSAADTTPPSVPGPVMGAPMSAVQIELSWGRSTDNVRVVAYKVFRNNVQINQVNATVYSDSGLTPGTTYSYAVAAVDNTGNVSALTAPVQVFTAPADSQPPSTPSRMSATAGRDIVYLSWTPSSDNIAVTGYDIFRDNVKIATSPSFTYQDTTVTGSTSYTYKVQAFDANGNVSGFPAPVTVTTPDTLPPSVPGTPTATPVSTTQIKVSWPAAVDNIKVAGYKIFRNGVYVTSWGLTQYLDSELTPSTSYSYTIVAVDTSANESAASAAAGASTQTPDTTPPATPVIESATAVSTTQIVLRWTASTDNNSLAGYHVYRNGTKVASVVATGWMDSALTPSTTYSYTVVAVDAVGNMSPSSAPVSGTTLTPPDKTVPSVPTGVQATALAPNRVSVQWAQSTDNVAVTGYKIFRNGILIAVSPASPFTDNLVIPNTTYTYAIAAYDAGGNTSGKSAVSTVTTPR
jgi:chitodextrinase